MCYIESGQMKFSRCTDILLYITLTIKVRSQLKILTSASAYYWVHLSSREALNYKIKMAGVELNMSTAYKH